MIWIPPTANKMASRMRNFCAIASIINARCRVDFHSRHFKRFFLRRWQRCFKLSFKKRPAVLFETVAFLTQRNFNDVYRRPFEEKVGSWFIFNFYDQLSENMKINCWFVKLSLITINWLSIVALEGRRRGRYTMGSLCVFRKTFHFTKASLFVAWLTHSL